MKHYFMSEHKALLTQWREAFPEAVVVSECPKNLVVSDSFIWVSDTYPNVLSVIGDVSAQKIPVVVLSLTPSVNESTRFLAAGALGYCHALASSVMLQRVADSVLAGGIWLGADLIQQLLRRLVTVEKQPSNQSSLVLEQLTPKEKQVAEWVAKGLTNKEVARSLAITERTVKAHLAAIFDKLNVRDRIQLALRLHSA